MSPEARFGRFDLQVRLVLLLLVVFLGVLSLMNAFLLGWARDELDRSGRAEADVAGRALADRLRPAILDDSGSSIGASFLRRRAVESGFRSVRVVDPRSGLPLVATNPRPMEGGPPPLTLVPPDERAGLAAGRHARIRSDGTAGAGSAWIVFVPVLAPDGDLRAVVEATRDQPNLARLERWIGRIRTIQIVGLGVVAVVAVVFGNWVSRPYRALARVAGEAGLATAASDESAEPDALARAFRSMVDRMREQDRALGTVERGAGGLGELVRFARGPAAAMATGVLVLDRRRRIAALNRTAADLLRIDADDAIGKTLASVAPSIPGLASLLADCIERGRTASREVLPARWSDGRRAHLGVTLSPSPGPASTPSGALVLMTDLTEIRELHEQTRVRDNLAAVGEVSAGIAHEIRNALGTILANARMIERREDPLAGGPARAIVKEVEEVRKVVEDFLTYARPAPPRPERFELRSVAVRAAAAAPDDAEVTVEGEFGAVDADVGLVARVFDNLVSNAAQAAGERGQGVRVTIRGRRAADGRSIQVEVEDDGPGIPSEDLERVFVPFYTSRTRGTGLGLATVRRTMSDLGGSVEAARAAGGGACFRLRFPTATDPVVRSESAPV